jgi:meso-butanediol dehydrogenase/(S,S)-butanediol dehydrogenase/diacetyl reductase
VALRLARRAASVGLIDRDADGLAATAEKIRAKGGTAHAFAADVSNGEELADAISSFSTDAGGLKTVVSCAGIVTEHLLHETDERDWNNVIAVNLTGTFLLAKHTLPHLLQGGAGSFTAISSDSGVHGAIGYGAYSASKHGVIGIVRCMALEYGPAGIRSNAVCPAFVDTPMAEAIFQRAAPGMRENYRKLVPLKRFALADEVAKVVAHLSSDEASYTNGSIYMVDGGATAGYFVE